MYKWAIKSVLTDRGALYGSALGIACVLILVLFFEAVWQGESEQIIAYPNKMKPDVWVMQKGVANMHMAMSFIWDWKADAIRKIPEVKTVTPILYVNSVMNIGESKIFAFIVGLDSPNNRAGPWSLTQGRNLHNSGEIIIPDALADLTNTHLGDTAQLSDKTFTMVGFSKGTYSSANPVFFTLLDDLENLLSSFGNYSYLLVDAHEGVDNDDLATKIITTVNKVNALSHEQFIANDYDMARQMGVDIIVIMTLICSLLAILIVGYSSYLQVLRRKRDIAVLKAIGVDNYRIFLCIIIQAIITVSIGITIALLFSLSLFPFIPEVVPQLTLKITISTLLKLSFISITIAILGAIIPAGMVLKLDPASAYQT